MSTHVEHTIPATNGVHLIPVNSNANLSITPTVHSSGTYTAGTLVYRARAYGATEYETLSPNSSSLVSGSRQTISIVGQPISHIEVTVASFAGTADTIAFSVNDWE
jgi:hypothetical protein